MDLSSKGRNSCNSELFFFGNLVEKCKNHLVNKTYNKISKKRFFEFFDDLNQENGGHLGFWPPETLAQGGKSRKVEFYKDYVLIFDI